MNQKGKRLTLVDEIQKESARNQKPGPGAYDAKLNHKLLGAFNLKDIKSPGFIDDA